MSDFVFKKKYGQNFLSDKNLLNAIADDAEIDANSEVLEIGAGAGSLTSVLDAKAKKVISFEIDKDLKETLLSLNLKKTTFVFDDFMNYEMQDVDDMFNGGFKVVANLPYYITTPIIFKLLTSSKLQSLTIMVQKEVAERISAKVGGKDYGSLTVLTQFFGESKITRIVKRQMFHPEPNVDSAILLIKIDRNKHPDVDAEKFLKFVQNCFAMRRKTILNNLGAIYDKALLKQVFDEKTLARRAESFSLQEFVEMFEKCQKL
ncbi:MAG: ribosomal RNA small subunit methyltransferase A [Clostridia bacterium]|nr:ribosomal RNA small subunit methyltransferase A [Clostridia bacterium]